MVGPQIRLIVRSHHVTLLVKTPAIARAVARLLGSALGWGDYLNAK